MHGVRGDDCWEVDDLRFYKYLSDDYILYIGAGMGGIEITESEYNEIMLVVKNRPQDTDTIGYRLKTDLTWEQYEKESEPEPEPEAEEILSILTGGAE